ncbi:MAG: RMD1 family protein [Nannocystis sp.]|jgi:uncharacterized Rmd1/YagE family protein|nr:RMD1 family protein [Nannocystis sp.]
MPSEIRVHAYSFASRFNLRDVIQWFPGASGVKMAKTQASIELGPEARAFAFDFGTLVFVGVEEAARASIVGTFMAMLAREPHAPLEEDLLIEVRPGASIEVTFDRVVLPTLTPASLEVIATVAAQSVSLDYYEEDIQGILDRIGAIARDVAQRGRVGGGTRDLVGFVGAAIASQIDVVAALALLDKPDLTWEDEAADRLHERLRYHLEIPERYRALETKTQTGRDALHSLLELSSTRRMLFMEASIVVLIVLEVVMSLLKWS